MSDRSKMVEKVSDIQSLGRLIEFLEKNFNKWLWKGWHHDQVWGVKTLDLATGLELVFRMHRPTGGSEELPGRRKYGEEFDRKKHRHSYELQIVDRAGKYGWLMLFDNCIDGLDSDNELVKKAALVFERMSVVAKFSVKVGYSGDQIKLPDIASVLTQLSGSE